MSEKPYKFVTVADNILGVRFSGKFSAIHMSLMFMRIQEYTEGVVGIRGRFQIEGDTIIEYLNERKTVYYIEEFEGFNITRRTIVEALNQPINKVLWNRYESDLFREVHSRFQNQQNYSIVAWIKGDTATFQHEMCHAAYELNENYRDEVNRAMENEPLTEAIKFLEKRGYFISPRILLDETNAFAVTDKPKVVNKLGLRKKTLKRLKTLYKRYVK